MESSDTTLNNVLQIVLVLSIYFIWYYITLPGSYLSYNKNKHIKPSFKASFKQYFGMYLVPTYILGFYLMYKIQNNPLIQEDLINFIVSGMILVKKLM